MFETAVQEKRTTLLWGIIMGSCLCSVTRCRLRSHRLTRRFKWEAHDHTGTQALNNRRFCQSGLCLLPPPGNPSQIFFSA